LSSATRLGRETAPAGFKDLSPGFDSLVRNIEQRYGYQMIDRVETTENRTLRVIPTREWLIYGGRQDHLLAALAFYEMWKSKQKDEPVNLFLMDEKGGQYITISDAASGPSLMIHPLGRDQVQSACLTGRAASPVQPAAMGRLCRSRMARTMSSNDRQPAIALACRTSASRSRVRQIS
jgi:hypothetical protein